METSLVRGNQADSGGGLTNWDEMSLVDTEVEDNSAPAFWR